MKTNLNINVYQSRNKKIFGHLFWFVELLPFKLKFAQLNQEFSPKNLMIYLSVGAHLN
jgi:hypothetical protein